MITVCGFLSTHKNYYGSSPSSHASGGSRDNPTGPSSGTARVIRGGSFINSGNYCRTAYRGNDNPDNRSSGVGFRLAK